LFRFALYGFLGVALEICFYNLVRTFREVPVLNLLFQFDWRVNPALNLDAVWNVPATSLYGQCSLWMFPVHAIACFDIEVLYRRIPRTCTSRCARSAKGSSSSCGNVPRAGSSTGSPASRSGSTQTAATSFR
jgi:hypothetical protein